VYWVLIADLDIGRLFLLMVLLIAISMFSSNLGIGGGVFQVVVLLMLLPGNPAIPGSPTMAEVVPISLAFACITNISSTYNHWKKGLVDFKIGAYVLITALLGAILGALFTVNVRQFWVMLLFVVVLLAITIRMVYRFVKKMRGDKAQEKEDIGKMTPAHIAVVVAFSIVTGFVSGSIGIGGGIVTVSLLIILLGFTTRKAIGTSAFTIPAITVFGFLTYAYTDLTDVNYSINYLLILILAPVVLIGSFIGSKIGLKFVKTEVIEGAFICVLMVVMCKMAYETYFAF